VRLPDGQVPDGPALIAGDQRALGLRLPRGAVQVERGIEQTRRLVVTVLGVVIEDGTALADQLVVVGLAPDEDPIAGDGV
jgi:hypothetical protein